MVLPPLFFLDSSEKKNEAREWASQLGDSSGKPASGPGRNGHIGLELVVLPFALGPGLLLMSNTREVMFLPLHDSMANSDEEMGSKHPPKMFIGSCRVTALPFRHLFFRSLVVAPTLQRDAIHTHWTY